jgi:hypothetical protein
MKQRIINPEQVRQAPVVLLCLEISLTDACT